MRGITSRGDAIRCDPIRCDAMLGGDSDSNSSLTLRSAGLCHFPFLCPPPLCSIVGSPYLSCLTVQRRRTPSSSAMPMPCHAAGARKVGVQCRSFTPSSFLDEANCPSGIVIVYRADGSRLLPGPPMHPPPKPMPLRIPSATSRVRCLLRGVDGTRGVRLVSFPPHCTTRNGMKIAPSGAPLFLFLGLLKCVSPALLP